MVIPTGYAQVNYYFVGGGLPRGAQIAIGVDPDAGLSVSAVAAAAASAFADTILPILSEGITLEKVKCKFGPNDTGAENTVNVGTPGGATADEPLPPNVAVLVSKHTALGGRKNAGKMFIPGCTEDSTTGGGYLTPTALAAFQTACDDFFDALDSALIPMVVLHSDATTPNLVTDLGVQQLMATQKRRIRRAGGHSAA